MNGQTYTTVGTYREDADGCNADQVLILTLGTDCTVECVLPVIDDIVTEPAGCNEGGSITILTTLDPSTYAYTWTPDSGRPNADGNARTNLEVGVYDVIITLPGADACFVKVNVEVENAEAEGATVNIENVIGLTCLNENGATIDFTVDYEEGYALPAEVVIVNDADQEVTNGTLTAGDYCILVKDANGCTTNRECITLIAPDAVSATYDVTPATCNEGGAVDLTVNAGRSPYTFLWSDGNSSEDRTDIPAGTYSVTIVDANLCEIEIGGIIVTADCDPCDDGQGPSVQVSKMDAGCEDDGFITLTVPAGAAYTYDWSDISGTEEAKDRTGLAAGTYTVTIADDNGCAVVQVVEIASNCMECDGDGPEVSASTENVDCQSSGSISLTLISSNSAVTYDWMDVSGADNPQNRTGLAVGTYTVVVTDADNCSTELSFNIVDDCSTSNNPPVAEDDDRSTPENTAVTIDYLANDTVNGTLVDTDVVTDPSNGSVVIDNGSFVYTPNQDFCGDDSFTYFIENASGRDTATVTVTVTCSADELPDAVEDDRVTDENTAVTIDYLANDSVNGTLVDTDVVTDPSNGTVVLDNGSFVYTPNQNFCGDDEFTYFIENDLGRDTTTVTIEVTCSTEQRRIFITLENGQDSTYCFDVADFNLTGDITEVTLGCEDDDNTAVDFELNATEDCIEISAFDIGDDDACLKVCDATSCDSVLILVTVVEPTGGNGVLPIAVDNDTLTLKDNEITIRALGNDQINGTLVNSGVAEDPTNGTVTALPGGEFVYTPNLGFCGEEDSFKYFIENENGRDTASVTVMVVCDELIVMSGFSPNGDGVNDKFQITGIENYPENTVCLFNRWGNLVHLQKGYTNAEGWEGDWNEGDLPDGTYFYMIDLGDGSEKKSGYVQIHR